MDSLLNEMKLPFKKGQKISYRTVTGKVLHGTFLIAGTDEGTIVIKSPIGRVEVVPLSSIDTIVSWKK